MDTTYESKVVAETVGYKSGRGHHGVRPGWHCRLGPGLLFKCRQRYGLHRLTTLQQITGMCWLKEGFWFVIPDMWFPNLLFTIISCVSLVKQWNILLSLFQSSKLNTAKMIYNIVWWNVSTCKLQARHTVISTSIFSEKISPANDGLFVVDGLFVHEGLYVYVQLT